jgi:hypothetical protein
MSQNQQHQTQLQMNTGLRKTSTNKKIDTSVARDTATQKVYKPRKPVGKMMLFGAMSLSAYAFLFSNEAMVTETYTLGGWHAAFPVLTAFFFSFVHGAFASNLLSVCGLEAKK